MQRFSHHLTTALLAAAVVLGAVIVVRMGGKPAPRPIGNYPLTDGSDVAVSLLRGAMAHRLGIPFRWIDTAAGNRIALHGTSEDGQGDSAPGSAADYVFHRFTNTGTHQAYVNLIQGGRDLIIVSRPPVRQESNLAESLGIELQMQPVALAAFIVVINDRSVVTSLTLDQLRHIYAGDIMDWSEVGGAEGRITLYRRDPGSPAEQTMEARVMRGRPMAPARHGTIGSAGAGFAVVASDGGAIAYQPHHQPAIATVPAGNRIISLEGVLPSVQSVASREYPLAVELLLVTRADLPSASPAAELRDWLLSDEGQRFVEQAGFARAR